VTAPQSEPVVSAHQHAAEHLTTGAWLAALTEYGAIAKADPTDIAARLGIARALARGGHIRESYLVVDRTLSLFPHNEDQRRGILDAVRAEAGPVDTDIHVGKAAAAAGLVVWRQSQWLSAYLVLMLTLSVLPLAAGLTQRNYALIIFSAPTGGTLLYLYIIRHSVPLWRSWSSPHLAEIDIRATTKRNSLTEKRNLDEYLPPQRGPQTWAELRGSEHGDRATLQQNDDS
jgi:hypothetical protein